MRHLAPAILVLATGLSCNPPETATPVSGPPTTDAPEVLPAVIDRVPYQPAPTTTAAPTTTHTHPTTTAVVVPKSHGTPAPADIGQATARTTGEGCGGWEGLVAAYFPADQVAKGCAVLMCESQGNPNAVSPTNDHGLWQINQLHRNSFDWSRRYDPDVNTAFARKLWGQKGWQPWTCA